LLGQGEILVFAKEREDTVDEILEVLDVAGDNSDGDLSEGHLVVHALEVLKSEGNRVLVIVSSAVLVAIGVILTASEGEDFHLFDLRDALLKGPDVLSILDEMDREVLEHQNVR